jgi:hypothetical protein
MVVVGDGFSSFVFSFGAISPNCVLLTDATEFS